MINIRRLSIAAALFAFSGVAVAQPATGPVRNIVLVHGAFADGSGWKPVADILVKDGYTVRADLDQMLSPIELSLVLGGR